MAVTVVRGIAGKNGLSKGQVDNPAENKSHSQQHVQISSSALAGVQEAAVTAIKLARKVAVVDRISDPKEAKKLADEVAHKIKNSDDGADVHSDLAPARARDHLAG